MMTGGPDLQELFDGAIAAPAQMRPDAPTVIAFGGLHQQIGMPPFEFFRLLSDWDINTIFVRDLSRSFYQERLVPGGRLPLVDLARQLERMVPPESPTLLVGTSAGAYAALAVGSVTGARVLAVAPVTTLRLSSRARMLDKRWRRPMWTAGRASRRWPQQRDLAAFMRGEGHVDAHVYFPIGNRLDRRHAARLASVEGVVMHEVDSGRHEVIREMRDSGELTAVMKDLIAR